MFNLKELRQKLENKKAEARTALQAIDTACETENREMTDSEESQLSALQAEIETITAEVDEAQTTADKAAKRAAARATLGAPTPAANISGGDLVAASYPNHGFETFADYLVAVRAASHKSGAVIDERLNIGAAPTSYGSEGVGQDGGFAIPPGYSSEIMSESLEQDAFLPLTDNQDIAGNSMAFPKDETTPWSTDGIQVYWESEASEATQTKPKLGLMTQRLHKMIGLVPMTDELVADANAMAGYVSLKLPEKIRYKTNDALMNGNGAGKPTGVLSAGSLVTQAKETSQTAATVNAQNVVKMFARQLNPGRAVWVINPDVFPQLPLMTIGDQPVFTLPSSGLTNAPAGFILGRPVVMSDTCQTLGTKGDINLIDWKGMKSITKAGGVQTATSMHLWFDYDVMAFRATFRVDASPWRSAAVAADKGSNTRSSFVTLAARA